MKLSAKQAAKEVGKSTPTITRAIKSGRISAAKNDNGGYEIDPAELFRVFPPIKKTGGNVKGNDTPRITNSETPNVTSNLELEIKFLHESLKEKDKRISDKDSVISDLQQRLDGEAIERRKLTMLIADHNKEPEIKANLQKDKDSALIWLMPFLSVIIVGMALIILKSFNVI